MEYCSNGDAETFPSSNYRSRMKLPPINDQFGTKLSMNGDSAEKSSIFVLKFDSIGIPHAEEIQEADPLPTEKNQTQDGLYTLSNLDQIVPYLIEVIIAFKKVSFDIDVGAVLMQSLGKVLEEYYPLAGRLKMGSNGKMVVQCDDGEGGVPFVEAFSDGEMAVVVGDITVVDRGVVRKLVFSDKRPYETVLDAPPLAIQVTRFKCGGVILGVRFNHVFIDGLGFTYFMRSWCEYSRKIPLSIHPYLDRSILSPRNPPKTHFPHPEYSKIERPLTPRFISNRITSTKSFRFTPAKLSQLKTSATEHNSNNNNNNGSIPPTPTTFELVSALSWICWTQSRRVGPGETTQIVIAVDGRGKLNPPVPEGYFGNGIVWACARSTSGELTSQPFSRTVGIVHDAVKAAATEEYVQSTIDFHEMTKRPLELDNTMWMTKWSRLPVYEMDFGWGAPSQVAPGAVLENLVVLHSHEKGSEDLVITTTLPVDEMEIFEEQLHAILW